MGFLDQLQSVAGSFGADQAHQALDGVLQNSQVGGMSGLLDTLKSSGLGDQVAGWAQGAGINVSPDQLKSALGDGNLASIASSLGVSPDEAAQHLADHLPGLAAAHASDQAQGGDDSSADTSDSDNS